jgi:hypothetical protein
MDLMIMFFMFGILMAPAAATLEDLFQGEVELQNNVKLKGEQYWQSQTGDSRGFAYYGYKYGQAKRFQVKCQVKSIQHSPNCWVWKKY